MEPITVTPDEFVRLVRKQEYLASLNSPTQNAEGVHVGDLFYCTWGYEQTNVDFFQVVALKGKHTCIVREIRKEYVGGYGWTGTARPCRDAFADDIRHTLRTKMCDFYNPPVVRMNHPDLAHHSLAPTHDDAEFHYSSYA